VAARLRCSERLAGPLGDLAAFLLGARDVNVEHERIDVRTQLGDDESHPMYHQAALK
jgi:hypothetical protein